MNRHKIDQESGLQNKKKSKSKIDKEYKIRVGKYQINMGLLLGKGRYGEVYQAQIHDKNEFVACKIISKYQIQKLQVYDERVFEIWVKRFKNQIEFQKSLKNNENIVQLIEVIEDERGYYLFMELCDRDLGHLLKQQGHLSQEQAWNYFQQLIRGYSQIHQKHAYHRDLKPQNLLIKGNTLKISDFGCIKVKDPKRITYEQNNPFLTDTIGGSLSYMSPNMIIASSKSTMYDPEKNDIWSMGVILYKMIYGKQPFEGKTQNELLDNITTQKINFKKIQISQNIIQLLEQMLANSQQQRINFKRLCERVRKITNEIESNKKTKQAEKILAFFNKINKMIYNNIYVGTLSKIGFGKNFKKYSFALMAQIHQKRLDLIYELQKQPIQEIIQYDSDFYKTINGNLLEDINSLEMLVSLSVEKIKKYKYFNQLLRPEQQFLLNLLILQKFQKKDISINELFFNSGNYLDLQDLKHQILEQNNSKNNFDIKDKKINNRQQTS